MPRHRFNAVAVEQVAIAREAGQMDIHVMGALTTGLSDTVEALKEIDWAQDAAEHEGDADDLRATASEAPPGELNRIAPGIPNAGTIERENNFTGRWLGLGRFTARQMSLRFPKRFRHFPNK